MVTTCCDIPALTAARYEAPADVAAIRKAERNMGDFKLKSDPSYVIPEDERMTPQRKRFQVRLVALGCCHSGATIVDILDTSYACQSCCH